ncbi:hypothetical protein A2210_01875 [Candidatus Woesebacteria bacterium RIFOXYA1_FULL_40_18]|uniref:Bifunctional diacylglycerol kinase/phosphatase B n=5 Tax=Candidatus Woeseibacteriota TaxID=1752722 RepID=A0A0G0UTK7_9BACT|nr:MAG: Bifunctional diacylglycerol kinase/phosphatase B [Candidatus Woesebacteria bacterium GW2011_GWB1_40_101]KKR63000.1 MAG: Bifunctional diacylglycerol kinase/phosphatase B [Candidatus Woesebacteria bacterium GW2011_GWA1_40_45]OGM75796.1 MAG: hypothetical protein A2210_01875 [Candidatus Woesebacteria bacterium RIFOXYA1_FULL_40_18]OGM80104.1 MAG: hypothetical protein A2361_01045 [Candidatus Woesebacteria bacterium RIFOXYB1_FULL_40_26]OGM87815.1 MAG: hypothetical protein A2614_00040 [Candidat
MSTQRGILESFGFAVAGIREAIQNEPNFKIHLGIAVLTLVLAYFLKFTILEWLLLTSVISFVLVLELVNTSLEAIVDLVSPEIRVKAKLAKDVAAASVLIASTFATAAGILLFLPKILNLVLGF